MNYFFECTLNTRPILENSLRYIRSDVPYRVSEAEKKRLIEKGITTIIDLRTDEERTNKICPLETDVRFQYHCLPVTGGNVIPSSIDKVAQSYINMVDSNLYNTISLILNSESNVLYFCNAGKDRTGVISAVLLYKLGIKSDYIIDDYMKSKMNLEKMLKEFAKQNTDIDINVITPCEQYISEFLDWLDKNATR